MEQNEKEFPVLIAQTGPLNGQRWTIKQAMVIGRDAACDVVVPDRQVSRYHARFDAISRWSHFGRFGEQKWQFL